MQRRDIDISCSCGRLRLKYEVFRLPPEEADWWNEQVSEEY